jgi:hypothetical protein
MCAVIAVVAAVAAISYCKIDIKGANFKKWLPAGNLQECELMIKLVMTRLIKMLRLLRFLNILVLIKSSL